MIYRNAYEEAVLSKIRVSRERYFNENVCIMSAFRPSIKRVLLALARTDGVCLCVCGG